MGLFDSNDSGTLAEHRRLRDLAGAPFAARLDAAWHLVGCPDCAAAWRGKAPLHVVDQIDAAAAEAAAFVPLTGRALRLLEPGRGWYQHVEPSTPGRTAHLLAALLGCLSAVCPHLRDGSPRPAFARLPLRRLDCLRCSGTVRRPPREDADRCDVCGERQVAPWFVPFVLALGPTLIGGDACASCAAVLGIGERERAS